MFSVAGSSTPVAGMVRFDIFPLSRTIHKYFAVILERSLFSRSIHCCKMNGLYLTAMLWHSIMVRCVQRVTRLSING